MDLRVTALSCLLACAPSPRPAPHPGLDEVEGVGPVRWGDVPHAGMDLAEVDDTLRWYEPWRERSEARPEVLFDVATTRTVTVRRVPTVLGVPVGELLHGFEDGRHVAVVAWLPTDGTVRALRDRLSRTGVPSRDTGAEVWQGARVRAELVTGADDGWARISLASFAATHPWPDSAP